MTQKTLYASYTGFAVAFSGMAGSLYFSEILHLPPCTLCWYQRICLYPLVAVFGAGIVLKDKNVYWYALPLTIIGLLLSLYQNLLYYKFIPEQYSPCSTGVSCAEQYTNTFGFLSIPLLSLIAFSIITACLVIIRKGQRK